MYKHSWDGWILPGVKLPSHGARPTYNSSPSIVFPTQKAWPGVFPLVAGTHPTTEYADMINELTIQTHEYQIDVPSNIPHNPLRTPRHPMWQRPFSRLVLPWQAIDCLCDWHERCRLDPHWYLYHHGRWIRAKLHLLFSSPIDLQLEQNKLLTNFREKIRY